MDVSLDDIIKQKKAKQTRKPTQRLKNLGARSKVPIKNSPRKNEPSMLHVSNLHFKVTNDDVRELFSDVGPVKKAAVHYDQSGRSLGTAEVIFASRDAALRAIKKYHQLPLDGRPMTITLVPSSGGIRSPAKSRIGVKPGSGIYKKPQQQQQPGKGRPISKSRPNQARGGKSNFQTRNKRQPKKEVTAEELDADLEAYRN